MDDNYTCNCKYNSNSRDNEPCCRCDNRKTNADRIRNMSDEELAEWMLCPYMKGPYDECIHGWHDYDCSKCKLEWLQSEAE